MCQNRKKNRDPEEFSPVFSEITKHFGLLFACDRIVIPEELKRPVIDELHFGLPGSVKMLAEGCSFWLSGIKKDTGTKCSKITACISSGKKLKYRGESKTTGVDRSLTKDTK